MTVAEARKICPHFRPVRKNGKVICHYLSSDGEMCILPEEFRCRLKEKGKEQKMQPTKTITTSSLTSFAHCPRRYFYSYIKKIRPKETPLPILIGLWGHYRLANIYAGNSQNLEHRKPEQNLPEGVDIYVDELINQYVRVYAEEIEKYRSQSELFVEREFAVPLKKGYELAGVYDIYDEDSKTIYDHKFKTLLGTEKVEAENQASAYLLALPQAERFCINMLCTSALKQKKNENPEDYRKRLADLASKKPGTFFKRVYFYRSEFNLELFKKKVEYYIHKIETAQWEFEGFYSMQCRNCPFSDICNTGVVGENYVEAGSEFKVPKTYVGEDKWCFVQRREEK